MCSLENINVQLQYSSLLFSLEYNYEACNPPTCITTVYDKFDQCNDRTSGFSALEQTSKSTSDY